MPFTPRRHAGRILYRHADGGVRGREDFAIDVRADDRTIRSYCEIDEGALTRDASWTLGADHRPVEGHVRVVQHGQVTGSAWYSFTDEAVECESLTRRLGRASQRLPGRFAYLGLHPLVGDGLIALARGRDAPGEERMVETITCSYDTNGETDLVPLPMQIGVTFVGRESLAVPAGTFMADHYLLNWQPRWPRAKLWVHGDDAVFLQLSWGVSQTTSRLEHYAEGPADRSPQFDWPAKG